LQTIANLQGHPKLGLSWEGFAIEQIIGALETRNTYFWATHAGAELDLLVMAQGKRFGFELKYVDAPGRRRIISAFMNSAFFIPASDCHIPTGA
jgi:hypothetical protein